MHENNWIRRKNGKLTWYNYKSISDEQRKFDWIGVWTRDLWFDVPALCQLSYPALCWRSPKLSTIFARDGVPVRSHKPRNASYTGINTPWIQYKQWTTVNPGSGSCGNCRWIRLFTLINDLERMGKLRTILNQFSISFRWARKIWLNQGLNPRLLVWCTSIFRWYTAVIDGLSVVAIFEAICLFPRIGMDASHILVSSLNLKDKNCHQRWPPVQSIYTDTLTSQGIAVSLLETD